MGLGSNIGFLGLGFSLDGVWGPMVWGLPGFLGRALYINIKQ